tara:strand:+ start:3670 stop:3846 length:177 start_codon:yes stop_codon:yes gene_type:complete
MFDIKINGDEVLVKPYENAFEIDSDGQLVLSLRSSRNLGWALSEATTWTEEDKEFDDE